MAAVEQNFPTKDRRMLVLFLFSAFLLACDLAAFFQPFGGDHAQDSLPAGDPIAMQSRAEGAGQRGEREKQLPPQLAFFLGKPMAINRASLEDLVLLPGIGEYRAAKILARRQQKGPVHTLAELAEIPGISRKLARKINPMISFDAPACPQSIHAD